MKTFLFCLSLFSTLVLAQEEIIMGTPISIEDDGARPLKNDQPIGTLVPVKADINPTDGQLKLEPVPVTKAEEKKAEPLPERKYESAFEPQKYIQFAFGYLDSQWEKADPALSNGSAFTDFRIASDMNKYWQAGFAVEILSDNSGQNIPDNIRVLQYRLFFDAHGSIFDEKLHWLAGIGASIGDYSITKLSRNSSGDEVNTKISSGTIFGIIPTAGLRFYLAGQSSFDLSVEYHQYLSKPQSYIGGFALVPRFSFVF